MAPTIPLFYRVFFLYVDPLICFSGIYLSFFDSPKFIANSLPQVLVPYTQTPPGAALSDYFLNTVGSYSLCIFVLQTVLMQQYREPKIWKIVLFGILLIDLGLVWGVYKADPAAFFNVTAWSSGYWGNLGILGGLIVLRSAFILGIGGVRE